MRYGYIYFIRNTVTGDGYVGQTSGDPRRRWGGHKSALRRGRANWRFQCSYKHHGIEVFQFTVVQQLSAHDLPTLKLTLTLREAAWMKFMRIHGVKLYNAQDAGESVAGVLPPRCSPNKGRRMSEEQKVLLSEAKLGNRNRKGTVTTDQGRANISSSKKGKPSPKRGTALSDEQREKLRVAHTGKKLSDAHREAQRASHRGMSWVMVDGKRTYSRTSGVEAMPQTATHP